MFKDFSQKNDLYILERHPPPPRIALHSEYPLPPGVERELSACRPTVKLPDNFIY